MCVVRVCVAVNKYKLNAMRIISWNKFNKFMWLCARVYAILIKYRWTHTALELERQHGMNLFWFDNIRARRTSFILENKPYSKKLDSIQLLCVFAGCRLIWAPIQYNTLCRSINLIYLPFAYCLISPFTVVVRRSAETKS